MTNKYDAPSGPPPAYGSSAGRVEAGPASQLNSPQPAYIQPSPNGPSDYYNASPYQQPASPYHGNGYPPPNNYPQQNTYPQQNNGGNYPPNNGYNGGGGGGGYYSPGPQMGYQQQGGYGGYPQQGGYYGRPQGGYVDQRRGGSSGFMEAMLASLACCCCLDACLLF